MTDVASKLSHARTLLSTGQFDQARDVLQRVIKSAPADKGANIMMGQTMLRLGEFQMAAYYAERALAASPEDPHLRAAHAATMLEAGREAEAIAAYERLIAEHSGNLAAWTGLASALVKQRRLGAAVQHCEAGLRKFTGEPHLTAILAVALNAMGRADAGVALMKQQLAGMKGRIAPAAVSNMANGHVYTVDEERREVVAAHHAYGRLLERMMPLPERPRPTDADPDRVLRLGLVGGDFRYHAASYFFEPLFEHFDRSRMDLFVYSNVPTEDEVSDRLRGYIGHDHWRRIVGLNPAQQAERMRKDRIDIAVDCAGHTNHHCLPTFHLRPAPLQMTWLGYPHTTGMRSMDWRIVDALTDPLPEDGGEKEDEIGTERLLRVETLGFAYRAPRGAPEVEPQPPSVRDGSPTKGRVVFGSFTSLQKMNVPLVRLWARVLKGVPGSMMLIKNAVLADPVAQEMIRRRFEVEGVSPDRVLLEGPAKGAAALMGEYARLDIVLDTAPYTGMTTTLEATHMGVPMVTVRGVMSHARFSEAILRVIGCPELVASDAARFESIAIDLARSPDRLVEYRRTLRARLLASPACDGPGYGRRLEAALRSAWRELVAGK